MIVAIGRGGLVPGRILADLLDLMDMASFKIEHYHATRSQKQARVRYPLSAAVKGKRVLLVDDVSDSGETFETALEHLYSLGPPLAVRTAVLHHKIRSRYTPDFYAMKLVKWRWLIYPWALKEDLRALLAEMQPAPRDREEAGLRLRDEAGIPLSANLRAYLQDLLAKHQTL